MNRYLARFALSIIIATAPTGCQHTPPNLTPQAVVAFHQTQLTRALDQIRDVADAAHHTVPPLIDAATDLRIVNWHQSAIRVVHDAAGGWQAAVLSGLDALQASLTDVQRQTVAPYIALARTLVAELGKPNGGA